MMPHLIWRIIMDIYLDAKIEIIKIVKMEVLVIISGGIRKNLIFKAKENMRDCILPDLCHI